MSNKKLTTEEFIEKSKKIYGNIHDYSKTKYINARTKVCIICKEHGEFWQTPDNYINKRISCKLCTYENINNYHRLTKNDFIEKSKQVHGDKYDYSKVNYINNHTKVEIICSKHGSFWQTPNEHLRGSSCKICSHKQFLDKMRFNEENFIQKAKEIHGDKYDYSKVEYINMHSKIEIICKKHGSFFQEAQSHIQGRGCPFCSRNKKLNTKQFIEKSNEIYNNKFDYSKTNYKNSWDEVTIICPTHGEFKQKPIVHLNGKFGCPKCATTEINKIQFTTNEFIQKAKEIHGDKYDYSLSHYLGMHSKIEIICKKHGSFWQEANSHLRGQGCSKCSSSHGENKIRLWLKNHNVQFEEQKRFEDCRDKKPLPFDFYIPSKKLCIEFDGIQHFEPIKWNEKMSEEEIRKHFEQCKLRDEIKNQYCKNNNINLFRISYNDDIDKKFNYLF